MRGQEEIYQLLNELGISFDYYEHPPVPTVTEAAKYWKDIESAHCKNLFFRNHKGNRHYLVIFDYRKTIEIREIEQYLKQGKLTFASENRMQKYLGLKPGSVSPFGLINDGEKHVTVFIDSDLKKSQRISFHPNINTASLVIPFEGFIKYLDFSGNKYEFLKMDGKYNEI